MLACVSKESKVSCKTLGLLLLTAHQHSGFNFWCIFKCPRTLEFVGKGALLVHINLFITLQTNGTQSSKV